MRLSKEEAVSLIKNEELKSLGEMAYKKKLELHPKKITTFVVDRNINYTNICWVDCKFCAFYTHEKREDAYILSFEEIDKKIEELLLIGGTQILFQGGVHPKLEIEWYEDLVEHIHKKYPKSQFMDFLQLRLTILQSVLKSQ